MFYTEIQPNILLRQFEQKHAPDLFRVFQENRSHLEGELSWLSEPFTVEDVRAYIQAGLDRFASNNGFRAGIWWEGQLAGCISLHSVNWDDRRASLGYWVGEAYQGKGIITRTCRFVVEYAFSDLELDRLEIQCAVDNLSSRKIAERLGFLQEGILRQSWRRQGVLVDQVVYGLLRADRHPG